MDAGSKEEGLQLKVRETATNARMMLWFISIAGKPSMIKKDFINLYPNEYKK